MGQKLITVQKAQNEIIGLKKYITLAENYKTDTVDKWIIKQYAFTNCFKKIMEKAEAEKISINGQPINRDLIVSVINKKPLDELHKIVRTGYREKIRRKN